MENEILKINIQTERGWHLQFEQFNWDNVFILGLSVFEMTRSRWYPLL